MWTLDLLPGAFAIARLGPDAAIPSWPGGDFVQIARSPDELSIVCREELVPDGVQRVGDRRVIKVRGPLPFETVGVLASLCETLAASQIPVFVVSTYDTDYLLIEEESLDSAIASLRAQGNVVCGHPAE